jgi:protein-S-isoprenylcysteine O-methyltransferase Ste14
MRALHLIAGFILAFEMPVPIYWLILHGRIEFWRRHVRAGYWVAVLAAWGGGGWLLYHFRSQLFLGQLPATGTLVAGAALIALDVFTFTTVELELGGRRLVGHAELTHSGELTTRGLYTRVRHPRYLGMMAAVLGGCLLMGTQWLWIVSALWCLMALGTIRLEERELRLRFGSAYADYAKCVPALLPFRFGPRQG